MGKAFVRTVYAVAVLGMGGAAYADDDALFLAAFSGTVAEMRAALDTGGNLEARDEYGNTPLHMAAFANKNSAVTETLLDVGANPNARNENGVTPFDLVKHNEALQGTDAYWRLNEARF